MEKQIIEFKANGQQLEMVTPFKTYAANTIRYIEAHFIFNGDAWSGYDNVFSVWYTDDEHIKSAEIINGAATVPAEILAKPGTLQMNLCANLERDGVLVARMTSYPVKVMKLKKSEV